MLRLKGFLFLVDEIGYTRPAFLTVIKDIMVK
ncbi:hypothetical protein SDC9_83784 [bioreactor metagenome]|uniref:Uncharacterized protein n=1 Tax=bioreactor metagenome TaxID=1076179 RepID=A0A644ZA70_9ZZZZ